MYVNITIGTLKIGTDLDRMCKKTLSEKKLIIRISLLFLISYPIWARQEEEEEEVFIYRIG